MQGAHSIEYISSLHKGSLRRTNHMISHHIKSDYSNLGEDFKANIKEADRSILLDSFCFSNLK
jgi:hypothetical protein